MGERSGYPHELVGDPAPAPVAPSARVLGMARRAETRALTIGGHLAAPTRAAGSWRLAGSIVQLVDEANAANPGRDKSSDGTIGDARHVAEGSSSDHNPWVTVAGVGVVRAADLDVDGLDLVAAVERARVAAAAGRLPQLVGGGYIILNGRITNEDFSGWHAYTGADQHITHAHFSTSRDAARFDDRRPWGIFGTAGPQPAAQPAPAGPGWTGPDLRGVGPALRGDRGNNGGRVANLQGFLRDTYPAYRHELGERLLTVDGWWGEQTSSWLRLFAQRSGIPSADGANVGPKLALALYRAGCRP